MFARVCCIHESYESTDALSVLVPVSALLICPSSWS